LALVCAAQPGTLPFPSVSLAQANPGTTVSYRWWWRTNAPNSNWTQLAQGTNLASFNHNPTNIPADATELQYRRDAVVGTCVVLGNPMRVGLMRNGTDNTPMPPLNPVCAGEALAINLGNNQGGVTYQWQTSPSGLADTWQEVPGATNASLITTATATAYYRRRSTLAGCTNVFTAPVRVLVTPRATVKIEQEYHYDANRQVLVGVTLVARGADSYTWTMNGTAYPGPFTINFADFAGVRIFRATAVVAGSPCPGAWAEVALEGTKNDCGPTRENRNYVRATTVRIEGVTNPATVPALKQTWGEVNVATTYLDGLGRPIQAVAHHASPGYRDVVAPVVYDEYGRSPRAFMPYTVANPNPCQRYRPNAVNSTGANRYAEGTDYQNSEQAGFYNERFNGEEWRFFSQTDFEASPLDRALRVAAPGADWALTSSYNPVSGPALTDRSVKAVGRPNATTDNVYWFRFNLDAANRPYWSALGSTYPTGELWVTELIDEHNKRTWEFTDKEGRTVLKRTRAEESNQASETNQGQFADTYFIYNDLSQLVATIQPEGVRALAANPGFFADDTPDPNRDRFIFLYRYDARGRVVEKKVPGKGWEFVVYNRRDQVAMTQDAQQRATQQWSFTKYDPLGRPVLTGTLTDGATRSDFQAALNAAHLPLFDTYSPTGLRFGYSDTSFPFAGVAKEVNMVSYYDNYTLPNALPTTTGTGAPALVQPGAAGLESLPLGYRGSPTVGYERILGTNTFTRTVTYYDKYHRAAQMRHRNHAGGDDLTSTRYDFEGKVLETRTTHQRNANSPRQVVTLRPEYDHQGRTLRTYQQVATADPTGANLVEQPTVLLAELTYNELGQMASQRLHSTDEGRNWLQDVAYRYHLRGWLTHVNDLATVNNQKLFAYELRYNRLGEGLDPAAEAQHNGGIAATLWRTATATGQQARSYAYTYDAMGRLKKAHYRNLADPASPERFGLGGAAGTNLEAGIQYDLNGNILNLWREGAVGRTTANGTVGYTYGSRSGTPLDRLAYSYDGNMLLRVRDTGLRDVATQTGTGDFRNRGQQPTDQGTDYIYDANGSLTADVNKGATQVTYNHLGLATKVCFGAGCANFIEYTYDASGQKLTKRVTEGGTSRLTEYHGAFTYEAAPGQTTPQLAFMAMPGGRIIAPLSSGEGPGVGPFGDPTTYEYHYRDHLGNLRLAYRPQGTRQAALRLTAEAANEANEGNNFTFASNQVDGTRGYRSARSLQLNQTKGTVSLKPTNAQVRAGQAVRVSVRATYDAEDPFQLLGRPAPSTPEAVPANRLTLSTPVLVLPGGLPPGEVVNRPPPQLNLLGLARAVGRRLCPRRRCLCPHRHPVDPATSPAPPPRRRPPNWWCGWWMGRATCATARSRPSATGPPPLGRSWPSASRPRWTGVWKFGWKTLVL
ncbi:MAG: DUF6443 domain-containing protein, partial [Bernardetiaceae bacterium]|nr:DUF6443 domain-containing protein [Bernardetiaceae bacterium]